MKFSVCSVSLWRFCHSGILWKALKLSVFLLQQRLRQMFERAGGDAFFDQLLELVAALLMLVIFILLARRISAEMRDQYGKLIEALGDPPDLTNVPPELWDEFAQGSAGAKVARSESKAKDNAYGERP